MVSVSASSISSANQYTSQQSRLQEARRSADQAERTVKSLEARANSAQREADRAQENAGSLAAQFDKAKAKAEDANQGLAILRTQQAATQLSYSAEQVLSRQQTFASMTKSTSTLPVVNSQGQVTGKIINTTA